MGMALQGDLMAGTAGVRTVAIEDEMDKSFLDYAMSVIVARALPDVRDGLKPVHRRILWGMNNLKEFRSSNTKSAKSARAVGEVMGKYHPHGDSAIYDAMVRLAQPFSNLHPLIVGQGNFSNRDGDPAAAMRYTEARLHKLADEVLGDIEKMPEMHDYSQLFFRRYYRPEYTTIIVAGDVDRDQVMTLVKKYWSYWTQGDYVPEIPVEPEQAAERIEHIAWPGPTLPRERLLGLLDGFRGPVPTAHEPRPNLACRVCPVLPAVRRRGR